LITAPAAASLSFFEYFLSRPFEGNFFRGEDFEVSHPSEKGVRKAAGPRHETFEHFEGTSRV